MSVSSDKLTLNDLCSHAQHLPELSENNGGRGNYVLMLPRQNRAWVGVGLQQSIRYQAGKFHIEDESGDVKEVVSGDPLGDINRVLDASANYFFMVSLDLHRPGAKSTLPTMVWTRARHEILIDAAKSEPYSAADQTAGSQAIAEKLNQQVQQEKVSRVNIASSAPATEWQTELDEHFITRLASAVKALQDIDGKVIVTRSYLSSIEKDLYPPRLYQIYNHLESCCAASHYFQLDDNVFSLGCTPENIFSLKKNILDFDVVASTRGVSSDPEKDARWEKELKSDAKELKEHNMALGRYQKRLGELCKKNSVVMDHHHEIRQFRYVRHLYSHLYGELLDENDFFNLLKGSSPALSTYPEELIPVADDGVTPTRFYGGVVGRVSEGFSNADVFLNLRSFFINGKELSTMGGVGVVRESIPEQELVEVKNKLRCVMESEALWKSEAS